MEVDPDAYLRVTLRCEGPAPGLADDVRAILPRALEVTLDYERQPGAREPGETAAPRTAGAVCPVLPAPARRGRPTSG